MFASSQTPNIPPPHPLGTKERKKFWKVLLPHPVLSLGRDISSNSLPYLAPVRVKWQCQEMVTANIRKLLATYPLFSPSPLLKSS